MIDDIVLFLDAEFKTCEVSDFLMIKNKETKGKEVHKVFILRLNRNFQFLRQAESCNLHSHELPTKETEFILQ